MKTQLAAMRRNLETLEAFASKYPVTSFCCPHAQDATPSLSIPARFDRTALAEAAALFGRDGWERDMSHPDGIHWRKTVDGVRVTLLFAEEHQSGGVSVPASAFPDKDQDANPEPSATAEPVGGITVKIVDCRTSQPPF